MIDVFSFVQVAIANANLCVEVLKVFQCHGKMKWLTIQKNRGMYNWE